MKLKWEPRSKLSGEGANANLGHGLSLAVYRTTDRVPAGQPVFDVMVFDRILVERSFTLDEGKARAEKIARAWLNDAREALAGGKVYT